MNLHDVVERLTQQGGYKVVLFRDAGLNMRLRNHKLEVWENKHRYIVTKEYKSITQLDNWLQDQIAISFIYESIPARLKNSLYFLLVADFQYERNKEVAWRIAEVEKNNRVCRKYVIETKEDLKRIPALNDNFKESNRESIDFEKTFKRRLFRNKTIMSEYGESNQRMKGLVNLYFDIYDEQELSEGETKQRIEEIIELGSEVE